MASESLIIVGSCDEPMRGRLCALHGGDGSPCWERWTGHPLAGAGLALTGNIVIAASDDRSLTAWRVGDGAPLWEVTLPERQEMPPARGATRVVATSNLAAVLHGKSVFAVNPYTGALLWEYACPDPVRFAGLLGLGRSQVYVAEILPPPPSPPQRPGFPPSRDQQPGLRCATRALSLKDGTPQWTTEEHSAALPASDGATSLLERDGAVYAYGNRLHALDAATGALIWSQAATPSLQGSALVLWQDLLVAVYFSDLSAYSRLSGTSIWQVSARQLATSLGTFNQVFVMGDTVYTVHGVGSHQAGYLEGRNPVTGAVTMQWPDEPTMLRSDVAWRFCGVDGVLFVPNSDSTGENLHAIRATDGKELWQTRLSCQSDALLVVSATA